MTKRTMAEVRAECAALGVQPGRSVAECEARIAAAKAGDQAAATGDLDKIGSPAALRRYLAKRKPHMSPTMRALADSTAHNGSFKRNPLVYAGDTVRLLQDAIISERITRAQLRMQAQGWFALHALKAQGVE